MELKELIAEKINDSTNWDGTGMDTIRLADAVLSLPSGMEKVKECLGNCEYAGAVCPICHGSGEIVTDLIVGEAIETLACLASNGNLYIGGALFTKSGERIRMKTDFGFPKCIHEFIEPEYSPGKSFCLKCEELIDTYQG